MRILKEAQGMRERGHEIVLAIHKKGGLVEPARNLGFTVYELSFKKRQALVDLIQLLQIIQRHKIEAVNTHSSWDSWLAGLAAKLTGCPIIRTRHLSNAIQAGLNSKILYNFLADQVVTTCEETAQTLRFQANLSQNRCRSIPTGVVEEQVSEREKKKFCEQFGLRPHHLVIGTVCILRSWKGVEYLLRAAQELADDKRLCWLIVGSGPMEAVLKRQAAQIKIAGRILFTGFQQNPLPAISCMDIFALLSTASEGVSQASLQAAMLAKPLITTTTGGLKEVCISGYTGYISPPDQATSYLQMLIEDPVKRKMFGANARKLALSKFTLKSTLDQMEQVYGLLPSA